MLLRGNAGHAICAILKAARHVYLTPAVAVTPKALIVRYVILIQDVRATRKRAACVLVIRDVGSAIMSTAGLV